MPGLVSQIEQAVGGIDFAALAGGAAGQYGGLASVIGSWSGGPPGDFGAALGELANVSLPSLSVAGGLGQGLGGVLPALQGDLSGLVDRLKGDLDALPQRMQADLLGALAPLLARIETWRTLLASDWSCGLVPGFAPEVATAPAPAPAPSPAPAPAPAPSPALPPAPAPAGALTPAQVASAKALVDALPADLSVPSLLRWVHARRSQR